MAATMPKKSALMTLLVAVLCGAGMLGADARSLLQGGFPYRKCNSAPEGSPYLFAAPAPEIKDGALYVNLTIVANPFASATAECYGPLTNNVFKVLFKSSKQCKGKVAVYVNDERKRGSVYWDAKSNDVSLLRITKLNLPAPTVGARVTLVAQAPCNTVAGLTGGASALPYYVTQGPSTKCCPVNTLDLPRNGQGETSAEISGEEQSRNGQGEVSLPEESSA